MLNSITTTLCVFASQIALTPTISTVVGDAYLEARQEGDLVALARKARQAVATLAIVGENEEVIGSATGFLISYDSICTNVHVVEGARAIDARFADGTVVRVHRIVASSLSNDVVVLEVPVEGMRVVKQSGEIAPLLSSEAVLEVGERIAVYGAPKGLEGSLTEGIVSAYRQDESGARWIQVSAAISPGSSGSPVMRPSGEVVGMVSFTLPDTQALNFAVPVKVILDLPRNAPVEIEAWNAANPRSVPTATADVEARMAFGKAKAALLQLLSDALAELEQERLRNRSREFPELPVSASSGDRKFREIGISVAETMDVLRERALEEHIERVRKHTTIPLGDMSWQALGEGKPCVMDDLLTARKYCVQLLPGTALSDLSYVVQLGLEEYGFYPPLARLWLSTLRPYEVEASGIETWGRCLAAAIKSNGDSMAELLILLDDRGRFIAMAESRGVEWESKLPSGDTQVLAPGECHQRLLEHAAKRQNSDVPEFLYALAEVEAELGDQARYEWASSRLPEGLPNPHTPREMRKPQWAVVEGADAWYRTALGSIERTIQSLAGHADTRIAMEERARLTRPSESTLRSLGVGILLAIGEKEPAYGWQCKVISLAERKVDDRKKRLSKGDEWLAEANRQDLISAWQLAALAKARMPEFCWRCASDDDADYWLAEARRWMQEAQESVKELSEQFGREATKEPFSAQLESGIQQATESAERYIEVLRRAARPLRVGQVVYIDDLLSDYGQATLEKGEMEPIWVDNGTSAEVVEVRQFSVIVRLVHEGERIEAVASPKTLKE